MARRKESFVLVPLQKAQAKKVAQAISNETSRKILSFIEDKDSSETEIAKELKLPVSTVHYNIQALLKSGLIEQKRFNYSAKGNKVFYYGLAKKFIIISPKGVSVIQKEVRNLITPFVASVIGAGVIGLVYQAFVVPRVPSAIPLMGAKEAAGTLGAEPANAVVNAFPDIAVWFLFGAIFALIVYFIVKVSTQIKA